MSKGLISQFNEEINRKEDEGRQILFEAELSFREWKLILASNSLKRLQELEEEVQEK